MGAAITERRRVLPLPEGQKAQAELTEASADWHMSHSIIPSRTDPGGAIIKVSDFKRVV